jgi:glutaredoxin 3
MPEITVYTRRFCTYCTAAKSLLQSNGYEFTEVNLDQDPDLALRIVEKSGQRTVPQIFVDETSVGGFQELHAALNNGEFANLAGSD